MPDLSSDIVHGHGSTTHRSPMLTTLSIRARDSGRSFAIGAFVTDLGYTARRRSPARHARAHARRPAPHRPPRRGRKSRVVALLSLSSRPVLRLQGWVGTIEEFVVRPGAAGWRYRRPDAPVREGPGGRAGVGAARSGRGPKAGVPPARLSPGARFRPGRQRHVPLGAARRAAPGATGPVSGVALAGDGLARRSGRSTVRAPPGRPRRPAEDEGSTPPRSSRADGRPWPGSPAPPAPAPPRPMSRRPRGPPRTPARVRGLQALLGARGRGACGVTWPGRCRDWVKTSGTTSGDKMIPVTREAFASHRKGGWDALLLACSRPGHGI